MVNPPTEVWTGAASSNFGTAANWDDVTDNQNPASFAPGATTTAEFTSGGGTITGAGTAGQLQFGGSSPWFVSSGAHLGSVGGVFDLGTLAIQSGATIADTGCTVMVSAPTAPTGSLAVSGASSLLSETGELWVAQSGNASLAAINGGSVVAGSE